VTDVQRYAVGASVATLVYFKPQATSGVLINVPEPKGSFMPYSEYRDVADGGVRGIGFPQATWHWDYLRPAWYDALRGLMPSASGTVYIATTTNDSLDVFDFFQAVYVWPLEIEKDSHYRMDFDLIFRRLVPSAHPS
jgi:hypothetical protein